MSKGLGKLQHEILTHLAGPIPDRALAYYTRERESSAYGCAFILGRGVYDLRIVQKIIAKHRGVSPLNASKLQAAFSRAVRSLVRRGVLEVVKIVPVEKKCWQQRKDSRSEMENIWRDGLNLTWWGRQVRFVRLRESLDQAEAHLYSDEEVAATA